MSKEITILNAELDNKKVVEVSKTTWKEFFAFLWKATKFTAKVLGAALEITFNFSKVIFKILFVFLGVLGAFLAIFDAITPDNDDNSDDIF